MYMCIGIHIFALVWFATSLVLISLYGKSFSKTCFQVGMELKKVQKQGRDKRTQEDYPTSAKIQSRCKVVF